jgi:hypothetical protein
VALAAFALAAAACSEDPAIVVYLDGQARTDLELAPVGESFTARPEKGSYRWHVVQAPEGSKVPQPEDGATSSLLPDLRGAYLIERWFVYGLGEDLTHRFIVEVAGASPVAVLTTDSMSVALHTSVVVDGMDSFSPEGRSVTYHWRLARRPMGSLTTTIEQGAERTSFVPDVAGTYVVELSVFDGELWNEDESSLWMTAN